LESNAIIMEIIMAKLLVTESKIAYNQNSLLRILLFAVLREESAALPGVCAGSGLGLSGVFDAWCSSDIIWS